MQESRWKCSPLGLSNRLCDCVESPIGTCEEEESLSNFVNMETSWVVTHACFFVEIEEECCAVVWFI